MRKFSSLRSKARRTIDEMKNGPTEDVEFAGSSDDDAEAELLGLTRKSKDKTKVTNGKRYVKKFQLSFTFQTYS